MRSILSFGVLGLALVGCKGDEGETDVVDTDVAAETARIRVVHASSDAPAVDVYVKGSLEPVAQGLAYGAATGYLEVPAGDYTFEIRAAGAAATTDPVYTTAVVSLPAGATASAIAAGFLAGTGEQAFRVLPVVEAYGAAGAGAFRAILVHATPNAPEVGIDVGVDGVAEVTLGTYANTAAEGLDLPASAFGVGIWAGAAKVTQFSVPALPAGANVLLIATGNLGARPGDADGFSILAVFPDATAARVKQDPQVVVLHAGPDAPPVDLFAGAAEIASDVAFGELSTVIQVPPGTYDIDIFGASAGTTRPSGSPAFTVDGLTVAAGDRVLAVAKGYLAPETGEASFGVYPYADAFTADADSARVVAIHGSGDAPAVDVGVSSGCNISGVVFPDIAFGEQSAVGGLELGAGTYTLGVAGVGSAYALVEFPVTVAAGNRIWAVAGGAFSPINMQAGFQILAVNATGWPYSVSSVAVNGCAF